MNDNQFYQEPSSVQPFEKDLPGVMRGVFLWMFIGLLVSAGAAFVGQQLIFSGTIPSQAMQTFFYGMLIAEVVVVIALSAMLHKLAPGVAAGLFVLYAVVNGLTLSVVLLLFSASTILTAFLCTAGMFGVMAGYGLLTKADLSGYRGFLMTGLVGIIIASVVNMFMASDMLDWIICYVAIFIFVGLTAYDTQKIKRMLNECEDETLAKRITIHGALMLYLDFINIFLRLLRLLSRKR